MTLKFTDIKNFLIHFIEKIITIIFFFNFIFKKIHKTVSANRKYII